MKQDSVIIKSVLFGSSFLGKHQRISRRFQSTLVEWANWVHARHVRAMGADVRWRHLQSLARKSEICSCTWRRRGSDIIIGLSANTFTFAAFGDDVPENRVKSSISVVFVAIFLSSFLPPSSKCSTRKTFSPDLYYLHFYFISTSELLHLL